MRQGESVKVEKVRKWIRVVEVRVDPDQEWMYERVKLGLSSEGVGTGGGKGGGAGRLRAPKEEEGTEVLFGFGLFSNWYFIHTSETSKARH